MSDIASNIISLKHTLPSSVKLVAVSKTRPVSDIIEAYGSGHRRFGENRVQELLDKKDQLPSDIEWHLIGHLQRNKVKYLVPFVSLIQSVDTFRLLETINSESEKIGRVVNVLLQVHIAREETKFGFNRDEIEGMMASDRVAGMKYVRICGLMGMATFTSDRQLVQSEFRSLAELFRYMKTRYFISVAGFNEISMGMSGDYDIAVKEGSTIIRIGSLIFGERVKGTG